MTQRSHSFTEDELLEYTHGTAAPELAARIDDAQANDRSLVAELGLMATLKPALDGIGETTPPGELDWRRLEAEIRRETQSNRAHTTHQTSFGTLKVWKAAAVILGLAAFGQAAYLSMAPKDDQAGYQTASRGVAVHVLAVSFKPTATEQEISTLLRAVNGRIVDGPQASGLYRIAFETEAALGTGLDQMKKAEIVLLTAEE